MHEKQALNAFAALSQETRLRIVRLLVERVEIGTERLNVRLRMEGLAALAREMATDIGAAA